MGDYFNALDSKHISVNTQIWNARGDGNSAKSPGGTNCLAEYQLGWSGQMNLLRLDCGIPCTVEGKVSGQQRAHRARGMGRASSSDPPALCAQQLFSVSCASA